MPVRWSAWLDADVRIDKTAENEMNHRTHIAADEPASAVMPAGEREIPASRCGEHGHVLSASNEKLARPADE